MKFRKSIYAASFLVVLGTIIFFGSRVFAQSNGLGITPKLNYVVSPGSERTDSLYVSNLSTSQPLNLKLGVIDFEPQGETGAPKLLQASNAPQTPWSLKPYITLPDFVSVDPGKSKLIPFTIKIPPNLGAGSYYSAVQYLALTGSAEQRVNVIASADTLVFVNVPGNATEQLNMVQFGPESKGAFRSIFSKPPDTFGYLIKNNGNISESPAGSIIVKNLFGHIVATIDTANPTSELVLLGQTRKFEVCYPKSTRIQDLGMPSNCQPLKIKPGLYTAEIELLYGQNGQQSRQIGAKTIFWYLPLWFVVVVILLLVILAYIIYRLYRRFRAPHHYKHK